MGLLVLALGLAIPAITPAGHYGLLSEAYGLAFIWVSFALAVGVGMFDWAQQKRETLRRDLSPMQSPMLARA